MMVRPALRLPLVAFVVALIATVALPSSAALAASSTHRWSPSSVARALAAKRTHHPQKSLPAVGATASSAVSPDVAQPNSLQRSPFVAPALAATGNVYQSQFTGEGTAEGFFRPYGLAVSSGGDVFVADIEHGVIDELNASGSEVIAEINGEETKEKSFVPFDVAVNAAGDVYVADAQHGVVDEFEPAAGGKYILIHEITGAETKAASFEPFSLAVSAAGDLLVGDLAHGVVDEFNGSGSEVLGEITGAETEAESLAPVGLATDASGDVYVADNKEPGVVDEFEPTGAGEYALIRETQQGSSFEPFRLAVAANGDMYVEDLGQEVVDRFSPSGTYECDISGSSSEEQCGGEASMTPQGSFELAGVAIGAGGELYVGDPAHELIDIFSSAATSVGSQWATTAAIAVTTTSATLNGTVNPEGAAVTACEFEYGTSPSYGHSIACEQTEAQIGEASEPVPVSAEVSGLAPGTTYYYRVAGNGVDGPGRGERESLATLAAPLPGVKIEPVTEVTDRTATFDGTVNPEGFTTHYHFEYSTDGVNWTSLGEANAGSSNNEGPVSENVSGLLGSTTYHVRLFAESVGGPATSTEVETFTTAAAPPQIFGAGATVTNGGEATLYATIFPEQQATTYRFEYGTTTAYGTTVPAGEGPAGSSSPTQVAQALAGLTAGTTYHFRVVATNATNATYGADRTLTMALASAEGEKIAGSCVNEALRGEGNINPATHVPYSTQLPDCRADEQVTPPFKASGDQQTEKEPGTINGGGIEAISVGGSPVLVKSSPFLGDAGADGELNPTAYEMARGASGWTTTSATLPPTVFPVSREELASPADATAGLWAAATPSDSLDAEDLYRREASGAFVDIGPMAPPSVTAGPPRGHVLQTESKLAKYANYGIAGASADLSSVVFQLDGGDVGVGPSVLWPGDGTAPSLASELPSLYEYVGSGHSGEGGDVPALVGVDNTGNQISECGTGLGGNVSGERHAVHNGVSAGGATVLFTAEAGGCAAGAAAPSSDQVYARVGSPGSAQATINVAGTAGCEASVSCNVTSPVTFQGASSDGSKVFFTTEQPLLPSDKDTANDLYVCDLPGDSGATPPAEGDVDHCPDLKAISVSGTISGADAQSVVAISEEGSRVYFTATGVLTGGEENENHEKATQGENNLYVWEAAGKGGSTERTAFIATLPTKKPTEAQATPDGGYLVFTTTADLTAGDTSTAAQAFRYDAQTGELIRVSIGQEGFEDNGNTSSDPATLAKSALERLTVSEDGSYIVFQSNDALTPQVHGGLHNVYEWHDGNISLISDGTDTREEAGLIGMDASGADIFFAAADKLVGQDTDEEVDIYDARIDGGFPAPKPASSCNGEECQGSPTPPLGSSTSGSKGAAAVGNLTPDSTTFPEPTEPGKVAAAGSAVVSGRKAAVKLSCNGNGACHGSLELTVRVKHGHETRTVVIGHASYSIAAGKSKTINIKLDKDAMKLLKRGKTLDAKLTGKGVTNRTVKLKEHTSKHHEKKWM
jgi:sugar lactone lactonase YvrE